MRLVNRGKGKGHRRGHKLRVCDVCGSRCVNASRLVVDRQLADRQGHARAFKVGTIVCDPCLRQNPGAQWQTNPLPILTEAQRRRDDRAKAKVSKARTKCRPCGGMGCHNCSGTGRVSAA